MDLTQNLEPYDEGEASLYPGYQLVPLSPISILRLTVFTSADREAVQASILDSVQSRLPKTPLKSGISSASSSSKTLDLSPKYLTDQLSTSAG